MTSVNRTGNADPDIVLPDSTLFPSIVLWIWILYSEQNAPVITRNVLLTPVQKNIFPSFVWFYLIKQEQNTPIKHISNLILMGKWFLFERLFLKY